MTGTAPSTAGSTSYSVQVVNTDGLTTIAGPFLVQIVGPPTVSLATPASGATATHTTGQVVDVSYSCADAPGGPGLQSGTTTSRRSA